MKLKLFILLALLSTLYACGKDVDVVNVSGKTIALYFDGASQGRVANGATKTISTNSGDHYTEANIIYNILGVESESSISPWERVKFNLGTFDSKYTVTYPYLN